jgi:heat shock 70kDa protein 1/2/6/8
MSSYSQNEESQNEKIKEEYVIGIDLGTRYSCAGIWRNGRFEIIPDSFGNRTVPSIVAFHGRVRLVGQNALAMKGVRPTNTIYDIKRIIGRRFDDPVVAGNKKFLTYEIISGAEDNSSLLVQLDPEDINNVAKKTYRPEEICACILSEIRRTATLYLQQDVSKAVITVPAYFTDAQRQATMDAAKIAGLEVIGMINEPTAAALAYGLGNKQWKKDDNGNVIVYDLGAGTLDVVLMNISKGVFRILSVSGNTHLGGEDIDYLVMGRIMTEFQREHRIVELEVSKLSQLKLKNAVENAKRILSTNKKTIICVDDYCEGKNICYTLTREKFEYICREFFVMCLHPLKDVIESTDLSRSDIQDVILVGGSTRIPKIQEMILEFFKDTDVKKLTMSLNPDEVVSAGACAYAYIKTHHEDPFSKNLMLMDITPLSLGVETLNKQMNTIIPRGTVIPVTRTRRYTIDTDDQDEVNIKVFEGERKLTKNNFHLGTFQLSGFEKAPRGHAIFIITFSIDINGILRVSAREKRSDAQASLEITSTWGSKGRIQREDLEQIIEEAKQNEEIDNIHSQKVGLIHKIQSICSGIFINLKDEDFNMSVMEKKKIKRQIKKIKKWVDNLTIETADLMELEEKKTYLQDNFSQMYVIVKKSDNQFRPAVADISCTTVIDCDEEEEDNQLQTYQKIERVPDPSEYAKEEVAALIKTINELCQNILSVINNPVSNFDQSDVEMMEDYISSVTIWLYVSNATNTIEYIAKINEINKITEELLDKYNEKTVFDDNTRLTVKDELQYICLTLNRSGESNYLSLSKEDSETLAKLTKETLIWLVENPDEDESVYREKLEKINQCSSAFYDRTVRKNLNIAPEPISDSEDSDSCSEDEYEAPEAIASTRIAENLDKLINSMPDQINSKAVLNPPFDSTPEIKVKVNINRFAPPSKVNYLKLRRARRNEKKTDSDH